MMYRGTMRTFTGKCPAWCQQQLRQNKPQKNNFLWPNWPGQARASGLTSQWVITGSLPDIWTILCGFVPSSRDARTSATITPGPIGETLDTEPNKCDGRWSMKLNICSIHFISCQGMIVISVIQVQECGRYYSGTRKRRGNFETLSYRAVGWRDALLDLS